MIPKSGHRFSDQIMPERGSQRDDGDVSPSSLSRRGRGRAHRAVAANLAAGLSCDRLCRAGKMVARALARRAGAEGGDHRRGTGRRAPPASSPSTPRAISISSSSRPITGVRSSPPRCVDEAKRRSPERITLLVNHDNARAIRFYERNGFVHAGEDVNPTSGRPVLEDGVEARHCGDRQATKQSIFHACEPD